MTGINKLYNAIPPSSVMTRILDNGLRVFFSESLRTNTFTVQLWVKTGSIHEGEYLGSGLSHFLEHMIFNGSEKYPKNRIAEVSIENGGRINAYTGHGQTVYYIDILSKAADTAFDIIGNAVTSPLFPEKTFKNEKDIIMRERASYSDNPGYYAMEQMWLSAFSRHPARHPIIGYADKIQNVDRNMMLDYFNRRYSPERSFLVICGNIAPEKAFSLAQEKFGQWKRGTICETAILNEQQHCVLKRSELTFNDPLSRLELAYHVPVASHPDIPALDILSMALGMNRSSRLVARLENELKLAINVNSSNYSQYFCGLFAISATCGPHKAEQLQEKLFMELASIKNKSPLMKDEIERCVKFIFTDFYRQSRSSQHMASVIGNSVLNFDNPDYVEKYFENIRAVTPDDVCRVACKYLTNENCTIVSVSPECTTAVAKKTRGGKSMANGTLEKIVLDNGIRVILLPDSSVPLNDFCVLLPGGAFYENENDSGASVLGAELLDTGTKSMVESKLDSLLDDNAIDINISSTLNYLGISMSFHSGTRDIALETLFDIIGNPAFAEDKFIREQENLIGIIESRKLSPRSAAENLFRREIYKNHPYGRQLPADEQKIRKLTNSDIKKFYLNNCLNSEKAVIGIAGDFDKKSVLAKISALSSRIKWKKSDSGKTPGIPDFNKNASFKSKFLKKEQAVVFLGFPTSDFCSGDTPVLNFVSKALNAMNSSLFKKIRMDAGLAYYTGLSLFTGIHPGYAAFYTGTKPEQAEKALGMLHKLRLDLARNGLDRKEFISAKSGMERDISEIRGNPATMIEGSVINEYFGTGFQRISDLEKLYSEITDAEVARVMKKYFTAKNTVAVIVSPSPTQIM